MPHLKTQQESDHSFNPVILREYDIRGTYGVTLTEADAFLLGKRFAAYLYRTYTSQDPLTVCVGRDGRLSSPVLSKALIEGLLKGNCDVLDVGCGPTPFLYFWTQEFEAFGGIMVTGSHNPSQDNGFKLVTKDGPFYGNQISDLGTNLGESLKPISRMPLYLSPPEFLRDRYVERLLQDYKPVGKPLRVVWDAGNGATGVVLEKLIPLLQEALPGSHHIVLNAEVDGTFPNHHPDPTEPKNLVQLQAVVAREKCDLGIAFDGDGDRLGVVGGLGRILAGDQLMIFFARDVLEKYPGTTVIADVKSSQVLFQEIEKRGGKPLMWKTGHSHIKVKMKAEKALLAGEMSGHVFFADSYYGFDDALYASIRLLNILQKNEKTFDELYDSLPKVHNTPEMRLPYPDEKKFKVIEKVKEILHQKGVSYNSIDGIRLESEEGWWLLRASHTQGAIVARFEAQTPSLLSELQERVKMLLAQAEETLT